MMDHGTNSIYQRIISPSLNVNNRSQNDWQHYRHTNITQNYLVKNRAKARTPDGRRRRTQVSSSELAIVNGNITNHRSSPDECGNSNFQPTTTFKTTSLPAMALSQMFSPLPNGTTKSVPITVGHQKPTLPYRTTATDNPKVQFSSQKERLALEVQAKEHSRRLKRTSEIRAHRVDQGYYISGLQLPIKCRYQVDPNDLLRMKYLARRRSDGQQTFVDYQNLVNDDFAFDNMRESPGGQLSSPVPSQRPASSAAISNLSDLGEVSSRDGKWAQDESELSSLFDESDLESLRKSLKEKGRLQALQKATESKLGVVDSQLALLESPLENSKQEQHKSKDIANKVQAEKDAKKTQFKLIKKTQKVTFHDGPKFIGQVKGVKKPVRKEKEKKEKDVKNEKKDDVKEQGEKKPNRYMNEWLGIKPKPVDERYKPGKPKPNRIFLSPAISKKGMKHDNYSQLILTELEVQDNIDNEDHYLKLNPDKKYCFLNEKQKNVFGSMFDEIDKDKNGYVTLEELKLRMLPSVSKSDIKHFLQVFDINKDQTVDKREFTAICALNDKLSGTSTESEDSSLALNLEQLAEHITIYKEMFKTVDQDGDTRIDTDEVMIMVAAAMATELGADLELARKVVNGARDEYGKIDFIGFLLYMPFFAKLYKAIMAKPLTIEELEKAEERVRQKEISFKPKVVRAKKKPKSWEVF